MREKDPRLIYAVGIFIVFLIVLGTLSFYLLSLSSYASSNLPPIAKIKIIGNLSVENEIIFDASESEDDGQIVDYLWEFSDSVAMRGVKITRIFDSPGNYSVKLTVVDDVGQSNYEIKKFRIEGRIATIDDILKNPQQYMGKKVVVNGVFVDGVPYNFYAAKPGGARCIKVYVEFGGERPDYLEINDLLEISAEVTTYAGELELKVLNSSGYYVRVIGKGSTSYINVPTEKMNETKYEEINHTLIHTTNLTVISMYSSPNITIVDTDRIKIVGFEGSNITARENTFVEVCGFLTYYSGDFEIKVRPYSDDFVRVTANASQNLTYLNITVDELNSSPEDYNNTPVHLNVSVVVYVTKFYLFRISDINGSTNLTVYVEYSAESPLLVSVNDTLEIWGYFTSYHGSWEIKIRANTPDKITTLSTEYKRVDCAYLHILDSDGLPIHMNESVEIVGNITAHPIDKKIYVQDSSGGVAVYGLNFTSLNVSIGDFVCLRGYISSYNGEEELVVRDYYHFRKLGVGSIYILNVSTGNISEYEGNLLRVIGNVTDIYNGTSFYSITVDDGSGACKIFIWKSSGIDVSFIQIGDRIMVVGIVSQYDTSPPYNSNHEVIPRTQEDIKEVTA